MGQPQVHVAVLGERLQHGEVLGGQPGGAEQRQPFRQRDEGGIGPQRGAGRRQPLGRGRGGDALAQPPPQLGLPREVGGALARSAGAVEPSGEQLRPVGGVGGEEVYEMARDRVAPAPPGVADVGAQRRAPRFPAAGVDHLQQRPHRPFRPPGVVGRIHTGGRGDGLGDHGGRGGEGHARAHPVGPTARRAEPVGQALRQPPLHAPRGHRDDLGRERVGGRLGQQLAEGVGQRVGPFGPVQVPHDCPLVHDLRTR
jgi:hypothetical protein